LKKVLLKYKEKVQQIIIVACKKVKLSRYRPGEALGVPGG
jgi:hypothetical protein